VSPVEAFQKDWNWQGGGSSSRRLSLTTAAEKGTATVKNGFAYLQR